MREALEQMTIVIVGHVDHGKSTVIGRLLADTGSLPSGKLDQVKDLCRRTAKPFEYAFLLDALKDEQAQGITIDSARVFFRTAKRRYMIFDAPGHIEFLKNMVTGAAHAQAALLVIDAHEGIKENSRRHGYLLSMLGVRQVSILVNKMDLVGYDQGVFMNIVETYSQFLAGVGVRPVSFIPISAFMGENIASRSSRTPWYQGESVLGQLDAFAVPAALAELPLRAPVQDIYKFTAEGDERRISAGTIETGTVGVGDEVVFLPSRKKARVASIEEFNKPPAQSAGAGQAVGFTLDQQIYIKPGDIMAKASETMPAVSTRFRANIFWLGRAPLSLNKRYRLKLCTARVTAQVSEIVRVIDASELSISSARTEVATNEVAELVIETEKPVAFDTAGDIEATSRFVLVDNYEISGGGIITSVLREGAGTLAEHVQRRDLAWVDSQVSPAERTRQAGHEAAFILIVGPADTGKIHCARNLELRLVAEGKRAYFLGISNLIGGLDRDLAKKYEDKDEHLRRLGELARIMTDAGLIFIATVSDVDQYDIARLRTLASPAKTVVIQFVESGDGSVNADAQFPPHPAITAVAARIEQLLEQAAEGGSL